MFSTIVLENPPPGPRLLGLLKPQLIVRKTWFYLSFQALATDYYDYDDDDLDYDVSTAAVSVASTSLPSTLHRRSSAPDVTDTVNSAIMAAHAANAGM